MTAETPAAFVILTAIVAAWWAGRNPTPPLRSLSRGTGRRPVEVAEVVEHGGLGRFTRPRREPPQPLS